MTALSIVALVAVCSALLVMTAFVSARLMGSMFRVRSGYARLAARYPAPGACTGHVLRGQTAQFGAVRYTRCVTIGICDEGLLLKVASRSLGRHPAILVPWAEVRASYKSRIRLLEAFELIVGAPQATPVRVMPLVYDELRPRLTAAAPRV
jgi:hypothetical protein